MIRNWNARWPSRRCVPGAAQTESLLREARIVSKLQHANIVPLYDAGEHQGETYLVCAYVEGGTLAEDAEGWRPVPGQVCGNRLFICWMRSNTPISRA